MKIGCSDAIMLEMQRLRRSLPAGSEARASVVQTMHKLSRKRRQDKRTQELREFWAYEQGRWNGETKRCIWINPPRLTP